MEIVLSSLLKALELSRSKVPHINEDNADNSVRGEFANLKVALVADYLTTLSFSVDCRIKILTPANYQDILKNWKPDFVFIESVFKGITGEWHYEVAKQSKLIRQLPQRKIYTLIQYAKDLSIPTVFWNKDDRPFFSSFIDVAKKCDYVFTADSNFLPLYKKELPDSTHLDVLAMAYQDKFHNFTGFNFTQNDACFVGSYYKRILNKRKNFMEIIFDSCAESKMPLNIYDRHKKELFHSTHFQFPDKDNVTIFDPVPYAQTADLYKKHLVSFNINSVDDSDTMLSRRFLEILACGGILITNQSPVVMNLFSDYCYPLSEQAEITELLAKLKEGPSSSDKERAEAGAKYVQENHTWACRLKQIVKTLAI